MKQDNIYISIIAIIFTALVCIFDFLPRSTFSILEKRDLKQFPKYSFESLRTGDFTKNINSWFSDSEPYRDFFMMVSMKQKNLLGITAPGEEQVKFHAATSSRISGSGDNVRALMAYGGGAHGGVAYAEAANKYKQVFGPKVNVYCMVIPTAIEFYCPDQAKSCTNSQRATINNIFSHLNKDVRAVNVYTPLSKHVNEPIYLRTDHHWAPLGAYYAAQEFARVAHVPFKILSNYERRVVHRFVGSMYGYAQDISIKNAPEDFVFYVPKNLKYTTEYEDYKLDKSYRIIGKPTLRKGQFFVHYRDGNAGAYCTFMGGDARIATITTSVKNKRHLLILKDSFGNALPGYLFFSFEKIQVVDTRYFPKNMKKFVHDNKITDILFANNIFNAYSPKIGKKYLKFLEQ